jgi:hypothetical protein
VGRDPDRAEGQGRAGGKAQAAVPDPADRGCRPRGREDPVAGGERVHGAFGLRGEDQGADGETGWEEGFKIAWQAIVRI